MTPDFTLLQTMALEAYTKPTATESMEDKLRREMEERMKPLTDPCSLNNEAKKWNQIISRKTKAA